MNYHQQKELTKTTPINSCYDLKAVKKVTTDHCGKISELAAGLNMRFYTIISTKKLLCAKTESATLLKKLTFSLRPPCLWSICHTLGENKRFASWRKIYIFKIVCAFEAVKKRKAYSTGSTLLIGLFLHCCIIQVHKYHRKLKVHSVVILANLLFKAAVRSSKIEQTHYKMWYFV